MTLGDLRERLLGVRRVSLTAAGTTDGPAWARRGEGTVLTREHLPGTIEWEETGRWSEGAAPVSYRNRLRWRIDGEELHLAHCRHGAEAPVHLLTLHADDDGVLIPRTPHLCGADRYALTVTGTADSFTLRWRVDGPRKTYELTTIYR